MFNRSFIPSIALIALIFGMSTGCGKSTSTAPQASRLEHHQAAHHPANFADAVNQLEIRSYRIQHASRDKSHQTLKTEIEEMLDILEWLPAIAADSDLKKRDWETVKENAIQLTGSYESCRAASSIGGGATGKSWDPRHKAIESLRALVPQSDRRL